MRNPCSLVVLAASCTVLLTNCMVKETRPLAKLAAVQAVAQIEQTRLLDVGVREFEQNLPPKIANDETAMAKLRIYPDIRKAEAVLIPSMLRSTLETSSQWGAVRVVPPSVQFMDVIVTGRILESTGAHLALEIHVVDATGRVWIEHRKYESDADIGSYKTDVALRARDPFQNVYSQIANDLVKQRDLIADADQRDIRRVTSLRFAQDIAPDALSGYLTTDSKTGITHLVRLPAADDPVAKRVEKIRERDGGVIDTVDGYYAGFSEKLHDSYGSWRRASYDAIEKEDKARSQARTRTVLGAAAVLASIFVPSQCGSGSTNCQRVESVGRYAGEIGGIAAVLSGIKKYGEAKTYASSVKELAASFQNEVAPQVVELQGRTFKLTGTAEEQYREWRKLLGEIYREEAGGPSTLPLPQPLASPAPAPAAATAPAAPGIATVVAPTTAPAGAPKS